MSGRYSTNVAQYVQNTRRVIRESPRRANEFPSAPGPTPARLYSRHCIDSEGMKEGRDVRQSTICNYKSLRSSMPILLSLINDLTAGERPIVRRADSNRPVNDSFSARHFSLRDSSILLRYIVLKINGDLDSPLLT